MGKIRRKRTAFHAPAPTHLGKEKTEVADPSGSSKHVPSLNRTGIAENLHLRSIFSDVKFPKKFSQLEVSKKVQSGSSDLSKSEARILSRSHYSLPFLTKKKKRLMKQEAFKKKLKAIHTELERAAEKKKKQATPVVGDMSVLVEALPALDELMKSRKRQDKKKEKPRASKKLKQQQKEMCEDIQMFREVMNSNAFKSDPVGSIHTHLKYIVAQEREQMEH